MAEILSQAEIDALLTSVSTPEGAKKEEVKEKELLKKVPRKYDFSSPDKFSKDHIRTLQMIHEGFTRLLNSSLSAHLRTLVSVNLVSVMEQSYEDFIKSLPNPTIIGVFAIPPLEGSAIMEISPLLMYNMFDRLLGGKGEVSTVEGRELTDIEQTVAEGVISRMLINLKDAWSNVINLSPRLESLETNPGFAQIVSANERVASLTFEVKIKDVSGAINICLPHVVLEPIISKLSAQLWFSTGYKAPSEETLSLLKRKIERTEIPLIVELGTTQILLRDLLNLKVNDIIRLNTMVKDKVAVKVGSNVKFYAQIGKIGGRLAVQIITRLEERSE